MTFPKDTSTCAEDGGVLPTVKGVSTDPPFSVCTVADGLLIDAVLDACE